MSHFATLVIVRDNEDAEGAVARLLAPYNEELECEPRRVYLDAAEIISMAKHYKIPPDDSRALATKMTDWHGRDGAVDDSGHLYYVSTSNPRASWDWYVLGGRWTGYLGAYKPQDDPANHETCWPCQGGGLRNDELGQRTRAEDPSYTCNGCQGSGKMLKHASRWVKRAADIAPVASIDLAKLEYPPHALVTPDGEWHEKGRMGWFACVADEKAEELWADEVRSLLDKHRDGYKAVVVDCHI